MIGIIVALEKELLIDKKKIKNYKQTKVLSFKVITFEYQKKDFVLIFSGVGKANAAAATTAIISKFKIDSLINLGSACSIDKTIKPYQYLAIDKLFYGDVNLTTFGYQINQMAGEKKFFNTNKKIISKIKQCNKFVSIATVDTFVDAKNISSFKINPICKLIDMESCAIAQIAEKLKIPFASIKFVSDTIYKPNNSKQWEQSLNKSDLFSLILCLA